MLKPPASLRACKEVLSRSRSVWKMRPDGGIACATGGVLCEELCECQEMVDFSDRSVLMCVPAWHCGEVKSRPPQRASEGKAPPPGVVLKAAALPFGAVNVEGALYIQKPPLCRSRSHCRENQNGGQERDGKLVVVCSFTTKPSSWSGNDRHARRATTQRQALILRSRKAAWRRQNVATRYARARVIGQPPQLGPPTTRHHHQSVVSSHL